MASSWIGLLLLAGAPALSAAQHPGGHAGGSGDRRLRFVSHYYDHIWGWCDSSELTESGLGCYLNDNTTCSSHLSDGPEDADVEVVLGNLPNGSHLQFWAAYESTGAYQILDSPVGVSVYIHYLDAFPKFWKPEFNGGNVAVNQTGHATIRVRRPAVYLIHPYLFPAPVHVQLRVCHGDNVIMYPDRLHFDGNVSVRTKSQDDPITVVSATPYQGQTPDGVAYNIAAPWGYVHGIVYSSGDDGVSTTPYTGEISTEIQTAKDALDTSGLEDSPVYDCFLRNQYFSHIQNGCVDECLESEDAEHGQCARKEQYDGSANFFVKWILEVACTNLCGRDAAQETLHRVRLQAAMLLDVPFQEVAEVILHWQEASSGRRLQVSTRTLELQVTVSTRRWTVEAGRGELDNLIGQNAVRASSLLQLPVKTVTGYSYADPLDASNVDNIGFGTDPYEPAYQFVTPERIGGDDSVDENSETVVLVVGLSLGAVALGSILGGGLFCRHQRSRRRREQREVVEGKVADPFEGDAPPAAPGPVPTEIGQTNTAEVVEEGSNNQGAGVL